MQARRLIRSPLFWGTTAFALLTVVGLVAAFLYANPLGRKSVTFYTDDALSVRPGDDVRIAGVTVGKVKSLVLGSDRVQVGLSVENSAFVGDQSQVEVRMLTVVGGYYVNVVSLGDKPLGAAPIPRERTTMPYSLMRALVDTTKITEKVNPKPLKESIDQLQRGLAGPNVESLSTIVNAGNSLMDTLDRQRGQVTAILNLSDEWIGALSNFGDDLKELIRKISVVEATLSLYHTGFRDAVEGLGNIIDQLTPVSIFLIDHNDEMLERARRFILKGRMWVDRQGAIIRTLRLMRNKIERVVDAQSAPPELLATDLCFPIPGRPC